MAALKPCLKVGCPELVTSGYCKEHQQYINKQRDFYRPSPKERGYDSEWRKFRLRYLNKHPLCVDCEAEGATVPAVEVHHEKSIREYPELKYAESNLMGLCEYHHAKRGAGFWKSKELKRLKDVIIVGGAPASGKSTYIKQHIKAGDMIWDYDEIIKALTGQELYNRPSWSMDAALAIRDTLYKFIEESTKVKKAWIIASAPKREQRITLRQRFSAEVIVMDPGIEVCLERIKQDARRPDKDMWNEAIKQWYQEYERDEKDKVIKMQD
ncbi:MAG: ATP-binding protein [Candidatus Babeliales bacterium]|jgi:5-methylcytosine-specific restriction protein A